MGDRPKHHHQQLILLEAPSLSACSLLGLLTFSYAVLLYLAMLFPSQAVPRSGVCFFFFLFYLLVQVERRREEGRK